ncbi:DUF6302 family protein [Streptomyces sp. NPDC059070]|uniref:DUF6302 family protein n=1 Tax=Streptomyces sp. NPDC059070 TaxID=3346713 RepID=UPI0036B3E5C6
MLSPYLCKAKTADDYAYYRDRLAEPHLLDQAVAVVVAFRVSVLAVPVGGTRQGGFLACTDLWLAFAIRELLAQQPGFPDARVRVAEDHTVCHQVLWGEPPPPPHENDVTLGRFFGYSPTAIAAFLRDGPPAARLGRQRGGAR